MALKTNAIPDDELNGVAGGQLFSDDKLLENLGMVKAGGMTYDQAMEYVENPAKWRSIASWFCTDPEGDREAAKKFLKDNWDKV